MHTERENVMSEIKVSEPFCSSFYARVYPTIVGQRDSKIYLGRLYPYGNQEGMRFFNSEFYEVGPSQLTAIMINDLQLTLKLYNFTLQTGPYRACVSFLGISGKETTAEFDEESHSF